MALLTCDFFSDALQVGTSMTVVLPQQTEEQIGVTGGALGRRRHPCSTCCTGSPTTTRPGTATPPSPGTPRRPGSRS